MATVLERVKTFHTGDFFNNHKCRALIRMLGSTKYESSPVFWGLTAGGIGPQNIGEISHLDAAVCLRRFY